MIANGYVLQHGYGSDVLIKPGETVVLQGPTYLDDGDNTVHVEYMKGEIVCQGLPQEEENHGYYVARGKPLVAGGTFRHLVVRHYLDALVPDIVVWRKSY